MTEYVELEHALQKIKQVLESTFDLMTMVDFSDAVTFNKEDGTGVGPIRFNFSQAYSNALIRPSATACVYLNEQQLRQIRAESRAFAAANPYWAAIRNNKIAYCVGTGHVPTLVSRRKSKPATDKLIQDATDATEAFILKNNYRKRQGEKITRLDRDGEFFLRYDEGNADGILRVRFVEPGLIETPPGMGPQDDVWFGVQFAGDYENPEGYYIRPATYDGGMTDALQARWRTMTPASEIQHRMANVDIGSPRGLPTAYVLVDTLLQAVSTRKSMGRLVDIRARIAVVAKQINATLGQITPLLLRGRAGQVTNSAGQQLNAFKLPYGAFLNTNDQREYQFPSQNIETDKIVHSLKADLQEAAAVVGLADFTISGDSSRSFSNSMIKEGPMDRAVGLMQADMIQDDIEVYTRNLALQVRHGDLPPDTLDLLRYDITPPGVIARDRLPNTQADEILVRNGAMSIETMAARANLDPEDEQARIKRTPSPALQKANDQPKQAPLNTKPTNRGVPPGKEPGPQVNRTQGTTQEVVEESVRITPPTQEDFAMAATVLGDDWVEQTRMEILGLPVTDGCPRDMGVRAEYQPGIEGVYLGTVAGRQVWAVDPSAIALKHNTESFVVAGNSEYWPFLVPDTIIADWSRRTSDLWTVIFHELAEAKLMADGKWAYARAHRMATHLDRQWLRALRPELQNP